MNVFPSGCVRVEGHDIYLAAKGRGLGADDRVLYCGNCGQAVLLTVALARTPTPMVENWTYTTTNTTPRFGIQTLEGHSDD